MSNLPEQNRKEELKALVEQDPDDYQEVLDDQVRDCFDSRASNVNNQGPDGQIDFLVGEFGIAHLLAVLGVQTTSTGKLKG